MKKKFKKWIFNQDFKGLIRLFDCSFWQWKIIDSNALGHIVSFSFEFSPLIPLLCVLYCSLLSTNKCWKYSIKKGSKWVAIRVNRITLSVTQAGLWQLNCFHSLFKQVKKKVCSWLNILFVLVQSCTVHFHKNKILKCNLPPTHIEISYYISEVKNTGELI